MKKGKVNFIITDGDNLVDKEESFVELYNRGILVRNIQSELGLTDSQLSTLIKRLHNEDRIVKRCRNKPIPTPKRTCKNYQLNKKQYDSYTITKNKVYFGCIKGEENARLLVEKMRECNWDKTQFNKFKREILAGEKE